MLKELFAVNVESNNALRTSKGAEEAFRAEIIGLVLNEKLDADKAPIILPGGLERNAEVKRRQKREAEANLYLILRLKEIDAQIDRLGDEATVTSWTFLARGTGPHGDGADFHAGAAKRTIIHDKPPGALPACKSITARPKSLKTSLGALFGPGKICSSF